jgi:hypothetical protein
MYPEGAGSISVTFGNRTPSFAMVNDFVVKIAGIVKDLSPVLYAISIYLRRTCLV